LLYAAPSVGAFFASIASGWSARIHRHGMVVTLAAGIWGVAIIIFGFADRLWLALLWLAVAGASDMVSGLFRMTIWNQTIPDHLRGRLAGIEMVSYMSGPMLGNAEAGIVASLFSIRTSVISGYFADKEKRQSAWQLQGPLKIVESSSVARSCFR
jgi:MFS family permease